MAQVLTPTSPHAVLGVPPSASVAAIRQAYRQLARQWHPDVNPAAEAGERFRAVQAAYDALVAEGRMAPRPRKARRQRNPRGLGSVFARGPIYWIAFTHAGTRYTDSSKSTVQQDAVDLLNACRAACRAGAFTSIADVRDGTRPTCGLCLGDLRDAVLEDAKRNRLRSIKRKEQAYAALLRHLGADTPIETIDKERIAEYVAARLRDPVGSARDEDGKPTNPKTISGPTINRELDQLRLGFNLLERRAPKFEKLPESDPRDRWPAPGEVERVIAHLPAHLQGPMTLLRVTGWRVREALRLTWSRVDREAGTIRLERRDSKTKKARSYPYSAFPTLAALLAERWAATDAWQRHGQACPFVFWKADTDATGRPVAVPVTLWSKAWASACKKAKVSNLTPHDMRRGAARDLIRAGVDEAVAQKLLGHATPSTFRRYNITADDDLRAGVQRLAQAAEERATEAKRREA